MKKDYCHIGIVLDSSGSMELIKNDIIGTFREFIKKQKELPGDCTFSLYSFNHDVIRLVDFEDLKKSEKDFMADYMPSGCTALYDGIGTAVSEIGKNLHKMDESNRPDKVLIAIITDGKENASKEYNHQKATEMIKEQKEKYNWEFLFLAANQDAMAVGSSFGLSSKNCMTFSADTSGVKNFTRSLSTYTTMYRSDVAMNNVSLSSLTES